MLSVSPIHQHSKQVCGMIIPVKCHKQHSGKRLGARCCEQQYADLKFVLDDQTMGQIIFCSQFFSILGIGFLYLIVGNN